MHRETAALLAQLVDADEITRVRSKGELVAIISLACKVLPIQVKGRVKFVVHGSPQDTFRYLLVRVLERVGLERVRRCPNPSCGQLFLKKGRRQFCSTRCQGTVYMRTYRA